MDGNDVELKNPKVDDIVSAVKRYITPYEIEVNPFSVRFKFLDSDNPEVSRNFSLLYRELYSMGYLARVVKDYENYIEVSQNQQRKFVSSKVNVVMLALTILSTLYAGYLFSLDFVSPGPNSYWQALLYGAVFFSAPLLTILGIHELGHFFVAKHYGLRASLPFFIPFIPLGYSIGTFGAFISIRDPFPDRKIMTNIGAAGPIAGFLTAFPLLFVANYLQGSIAPVNNFIPYFLNYPQIYSFLNLTMPVGTPVFPMVLAVWVGIFATAMNLIPVGQLDGGHIVRGIAGRRASMISYIFLMFLILLSYFYLGWMLIAFLMLFLGLKHPPALDDNTPVGKLQIAIGIFALFIFLISFTYMPFYT